MFPILADPKITTLLTNLSHKKNLYVGQDEIIWKKKNLLFGELLNHKKKKKNLIWELESNYMVILVLRIQSIDGWNHVRVIILGYSQ